MFDNIRGGYIYYRNAGESFFYWKLLYARLNNHYKAWSYKKKKQKKINAYRKSIQKDRKVNKRLLILAF